MTRSRTLLSPRAALVALGLVLLGAPAGAGASGASYEVLQCHPQNRGSADARITEPRAYGVTVGCADAAGEYAMRIKSRLAAPKDSAGLIRWLAPQATGFTRVRVEAKLRRDAGHYSRLYMADAEGRETRRIAYGDNPPGTFHLETWDGGREEQFVAELGCDERSGCPQSDAAKTWIREVRLKLTDFADPTLSVSGSMFSGAWKRGPHDLGFRGEDFGSGIDRVVASVNGSQLESVGGTCAGKIPGSALASRLRPCAGELPATTLQPSTDELPFHEGQNSVAICAHDFAGNETCQTHQVAVDNTAPAVAFTNAQDPEDPELIQAPVGDAHSGVANGSIFYRAMGATLWTPLETVLDGGTLKARVDSSAVPPGTYEFRAVVTDVAGNQVETSLRADGLEKRLAFPLKSGVELHAALQPGGSKRLTIGYGRTSRVAGRLGDASGEPLPDQEVVVVEHFGEGALIRERVTHARTDAYGRWQVRLPAGPSRRVVASYAGTQRYLPASVAGGNLAVRTLASLRRSKARVAEGGKVVFRGRLGRLGARIPTGGKLVELQVKQATRTWQTVGEGFRSRDSGRYRIRYRFGDFYQYDVRFKFRLKVAREANWPYKAPVRSRARTVTVLDR